MLASSSSHSVSVAPLRRLDIPWRFTNGGFVILTWCSSEENRSPLSEPGTKRVIMSSPCMQMGVHEKGQAESPASLPHWRSHVPDPRFSLLDHMELRWVGRPSDHMG